MTAPPDSTGAVIPLELAPAGRKPEAGIQETLNLESGCHRNDDSLMR